MKKIYFLLLVFCTFNAKSQTFSFIETFTGANFDYINNTWGDYEFTSNNSTEFKYFACRNAGPLGYGIDGNGIVLRFPNASYIDITFPNGLGDLYFEYKKGSANSYRPKQLEILILNDVNYEVLDVTQVFGDTNQLDPTVYTYSRQNINRTDEVKIRIKNVGNDSSLRETVIDNVKWNTFATVSSDDFNNQNLTIYPNPAKNVLNIKTPIAGNKLVEIFDVLGKSVLKTKTDSQINISDLKAGIYIITVTQNGKSNTKKLVVK